MSGTLSSLMQAYSCSGYLSMQLGFDQAHVYSSLHGHQLNARPLLLCRAVLSRPKVLKANPALAARPRATVAPVAASSGGVASQPAAVSGPEAGREVRHSGRHCIVERCSLLQATQAAGKFSAAIAHCWD